jgi:hypothetical protein
MRQTMTRLPFELQRALSHCKRPRRLPRTKKLLRAMR